MENDLATWVMSHVENWRDYRKSNFDEKWKEYYRLWRGVWDESDKMRASERSRLISPATAQAVESTISELEEATFGRDQWFDMKDNLTDTQNEDIMMLRNLMKEDLEREGWKGQISEAMLNACLYGIGIGEILTEEKTEFYPSTVQVEGTEVFDQVVEENKYVCVKLKAVNPFNFSIDPSSTTIDDALGVAIDELVPRHIVIQGMKDGVYDEADLGNAEITYEMQFSGESKQIPTDDVIKLCKYYGKIPRHYLEDSEEDNDELVEALVVIANDSMVIKAVESPYMMKDRPIVAYSHDRVPSRFYGRGVVEKGYNAQKALDTELRARADALALTTHPMMAIDASRLPRGMKPRVQAGQTILTNGDPNTILMPLRFGDLNPVSYRESANLERMVSMGTGAMDSAAPIGINPKNATLGGMSMMMGASIKRQKRTLANFQENFLVPSLKKCAYRLMQFAPDRYPSQDFKFVPYSTLGLMAREFETQQLIQLLQVTQPNSPVFMIILQSIYDNSSLSNREQMIQALQEQIRMQQQADNAPKANPVGMAQVEVQNKQAELKAQKDQADIQLKQADLQLKAEELRIKAAEATSKDVNAKESNSIKELSQYIKAEAEDGRIQRDLARDLQERLQ